MELQKAWPELDAAGVAVFGLSYDAVDVLARFAEQRGITFALLSDEGSHAIRELGLRNEHVAEQHAFYGVAVRDEHHGVPYPGTFVLDEHGGVAGKYFEQSYRVRPTAALFRESRSPRPAISRGPGPDPRLTHHARSADLDQPGRVCSAAESRTWSICDRSVSEHVLCLCCCPGWQARHDQHTANGLGRAGQDQPAGELGGGRACFARGESAQHSGCRSQTRRRIARPSACAVYQTAGDT